MTAVENTRLSKGHYAPMGRQRITVRTKWQSGSDCGDASNAGLKGNRLIGNERYLRGKTNRT